MLWIVGAGASGLAACEAPNVVDNDPVPIARTDAGFPPCELDGDCPFGEECVTGECVAPSTVIGDEGCRADDDCEEGAACALTTGRCIDEAEVPPVEPGPAGPCSTGETRTCGEKVGECEYGVERCVDDVWAGVCEGGRGPVAESCNEADDDCNGDTDEPFDLSAACTAGFGVCEQPGFVVCSDGGDAVCSATPLPAAGRVELCGNGADDDCDGVNDDGIEFADLATPCSAGTGSCTRGGVRVCAGDGSGTVCDASPGTPAAVDLCGNGADDDCNGLVDDSFPDLGSACTIAGACPVPGNLQCAADLLDLECAAGATVGLETVCNGLDDDADSCADDGFDLGAACAAGVGACRRTGVTVCNATQNGTTCNAAIASSTAEVCGNAIDEDCDGLLDNGFDLGAPCTVGVGACQRSGVRICGPGGSAVCSVAPGAPGLERCGNASDENCDGALDEGFGIGSACSAGTGECRRSGALTCAAGGATTSCSAVPAAPATEACDDRDNDCDAAADNGCDDDGDGYCDGALIFTPIGPTVDVCALSTSAALLDCNDGNANIHPNLAETCNVDTVDVNCDGNPNEGCAPCNAGVDNDFDGADQCTDCDDTNGRVHPGATVLCDGLDNNCDGRIDQEFDADGDGFTTCGTLPGGGGVDPARIDCNDLPPGGINIFPGACELCAAASGTTVVCGAANARGNLIDESCDGFVDEGCGACDDTDQDGDGASACDGDCDDNDDQAAPGLPEVCDGRDTDCNQNTVANCEVGDLCDDLSGPFDEDADVCAENLFCIGPVGGGPGACTSLCNSSFAGVGLGDGCDANETCSIILTPTANVHGCSARSAGEFGALATGADCNNDNDCRSGDCGGIGANRFCTDLCASDDYCGPTTVCEVSAGDVGQCDRPSAAQVAGTGASCAAAAGGSSVCLHGTRSCINMNGSQRCTEPCCSNADCPVGNYCSLNGLTSFSANFGDDTTPVCFEETAGNGGRQAGAACSANVQCASEFCDRNLSVCVDVCCHDGTCPAGLACDLALAELPGNDGPTFGRFCLSSTPATTLEKR